jgi:hypothetical protein
MPNNPMNVKTISATELRDNLRGYLKSAKRNRVVLVENRRQGAKYVVDKDFLDALVKERESVLATLEILADRKLADRLMSLSKTIDKDMKAGRLLTTADVFGE